MRGFGSYQYEFSLSPALNFGTKTCDYYPILFPQYGGLEPCYAPRGQGSVDKNRRLTPEMDAKLNCA